MPSTYACNASLPLVIYHHAAGEDQTAITGVAAIHSTIEALLLSDYIVCASAAAGENWGNDASLTAVTNLYNYMVANYNISRVVFLSHSMGGLAGLLSLGGSIPVKGWAGACPVCNLANMYGGGAGTYEANIETAYSFADPAGYAAATAGHDPVLVAAATFDNIRMRFYASAGDTVVTKADNSDQMATLVTGHAPEHDVVVASGNHGDASHYQPIDVLTFFDRCV